MTLPLNPMGVNGPTQPPPVQQPDYRIPTVAAAVASSPVGSDEMTLNYVNEPAKYIQPGIAPAGPF